MPLRSLFSLSLRSSSMIGHGGCVAVIFAPMAPTEAVRNQAGPTHPRRNKAQLALGLGALGVVFGDIGTSPLYAFQEIFQGAHPIPALESRVFGAASLVFWTLTLVVSIKYVLIVMRADNEGEGGIMALASLTARSVMKTSGRRMLIMGLGILGAALFYGDGMITPAVSVLSAVEGLELVDPGLTGWVIPIAIVILVALFAVQRHGTGKMGAAFGPVMLVWFFVIAVLGIVSIVKTPAIIGAINPIHAIDYFASEPKLAFLSLGSVVLCVTGAEALYADMGQFGRGPIRLSWFAIAVPALYLNYFGQAALVVRDKDAAANPFYLLVPSSLQLPMVILATLATVIASQAVISGAFSMTKQAIGLDYLPRMQVRHTSDSEYGQVYVPAVNWMLMIAVVALVLGFRSSSNLASAYGIAVTGTFVITTCLITVVALHRWKLAPWKVWPVFALFIVIDVSFFAANLTKFTHGGWFPLVVAIVIFTVLATWRRGRVLMQERLDELSPPLDEFAAQLERKDDVRVVPGAAVYLTQSEGTAPYAMAQHVKLLEVVSEHTVILHIVIAKVPRIPKDEQIRIDNSVRPFWQVVVTLGFMDRPDVQDVMVRATAAGIPVDPQTCIYVMHLIQIEPSRHAPMRLERQYLYAFMQRVAVDPSAYMHFPPDRVLGVGTLVKL
ncbi:MAG: potassium transporter Kup [Candidatus Nanopelagicales bacterium]